MSDDEVQDGKGHHLDYSQLIKKLILPAGFTVPARLSYEDIVATAITRDDLHDDVAGINASLALIQQTRGGGWPTAPVTKDFNFVDLVWHELEFREGKSFTYIVRTADATYLGCCYLYPMGRRTPLSEQTLRYDVDVSWWVTPAAYTQGYYATAYQALRRWLADEFPFWEAIHSNTEIPIG